MRKDNVVIVLLTWGLLLWLIYPSTTNQGQTIKIGISIYNQADPFIEELASAISERIDILDRKYPQRIICELADASLNQLTQTRQTNDFIAEKYDLLLVNIVEPTAAPQIINQAMERNVPVIFFNRELKASDLNLSNLVAYVGTDAKQTAHLQAQIIEDCHNKTPELLDQNNDGVVDYILVEGERANVDTIYRTNALISELEKTINLNLLDSLEASWLYASAYRQACQVSAASYHNCELLICQNDDMALGFIDYLQDLDLNGRWPVIVGVNGEQKMLEKISQGLAYGTVSLEKESQADLIVKLVVQKLLNHQEFDQKIYYADQKII